MIRVPPSSMPAIESERGQDRALASPTDAPFRTALRAAGKADRAKRLDEAAELNAPVAVPQIAIGIAAPDANPTVREIHGAGGPGPLDSKTSVARGTGAPAAGPAIAASHASGFGLGAFPDFALGAFLGLVPSSSPRFAIGASPGAAPGASSRFATSASPDGAPGTSSRFAMGASSDAAAGSSSSFATGASPDAAPSASSTFAMAASPDTAPDSSSLFAMGASPDAVAAACSGITIGAASFALEAPSARTIDHGARPATGPTWKAALHPATGSAGLPSAGAAPPSQPTAPPDDSPVSAWVAASVARAIGSFGGALAAPEAVVPGGATGSAALAPAALGLPTLAMTPLEQAVHDLLGGAAGREPAHARAPKQAATASAPGLDLVPLQAPSTVAVTAHQASAAGAAPARGAPQLPEPSANPSHIHLVLDDAARTVVTVAMRGSEVHVALRTSDDATASAMARNAASLDHAMRARGLALGDLTTEREPHQHAASQDAEPRQPRERHQPDAEPFELEETP